MPNVNTNRRVVLGNTSLLSETKAWLSVLPSRPSSLVINAVNTFIKSSKASGNWQLLDRFWLFGQDIEANSLYSIVNPTSTVATATAAPTFTAYQGYDFNGTTQYLNTNYNPNTAGVNYVLNSSSHGLYCIENGNSAFAWDIGVYDALYGSSLSLRDGTDTMYGKSNCLVANSTSVASTDSRGLFVFARTTSTAMAIFKNGSSVVSDTDVSAVVPNNNFFVGALNNNGAAAAFGSKKLAIAFTGSGGINQASFYTETQILATSLGFNV